mmetsp:Transcript_71778/g.83439  ORF Transcript_71778/g.83439 Transcript_71778/m.83439 type:complete len:624 (-) Transcript_71778:162-2033(-)
MSSDLSNQQFALLPTGSASIDLVSLGVRATICVGAVAAMAQAYRVLSASSSSSAHRGGSKSKRHHEHDRAQPPAETSSDAKHHTDKKTKSVVSPTAQAFKRRQAELLASDFKCNGTSLETLLLPFDEADSRFQSAFRDYATTRHIDAIRAEEFGRLDAEGHVYLDYTGGSLYGQCQVDAVADYLSSGVFGNPHSTNPTSQASTHRVEEARRAVLEYLNADPREYEVIFTLNASGALRLIGESYPFSTKSHYLYLADNHNSVVGIREFAKSRGATVQYCPVSQGDVRIVDDKLLEMLSTLGGGGESNDGVPKLFSYPAQSNLSGVRHSLEWIQKAQQRGWDVLLDAAAFVPTNRLNLREVKPDFVSMSFYKIFGFPTGVGALVAQRSSLARLRRPWFAGGTIEMVSIVGDAVEACRGDSAEAYEDGTVDYLNIPMITVGLRFVEQRIGVDAMHLRVSRLTQYVLEQLAGLKHANGLPVTVVLGPATMGSRGGTIAMIFQKANGQFLNVHSVEKKANECGISIRTGCFCNPGAMEMKFALKTDVVQRALEQRMRRGFLVKREYVAALGDNVAEALRVSFGLVSNFRDAFVFVRFAASFAEALDDGTAPTNTASPCTACEANKGLP